MYKDKSLFVKMKFLSLCSLGFIVALTGSTKTIAEDVVAKKAVTKTVTPAKKKKFPEWTEVIKGTKKIEGLFPLHYSKKEQKLFMEISKSQYEKELILPISIAKGTGSFFLGGQTLNFGDQWIISFRRSANRILVVRRNVRYKATSGTPQADAVDLTYSDSIIKALPIKSELSGGDKVLVSLSDLFMTDLAGIGVSPDSSRSTWGEIKAFPGNVEIELNAVFSFPYYYYWFFGDNTIPDMRGAQVTLHYGLSYLPKSSFKSRVADDRVGHFLTTLHDFSKDTNLTPKVRYIRRWNLEKADSSAKMSPPKKPIIFWIEKTVPREYRPYVRSGILEWNKAFEKLGYIEAIQCRDQQETDDFDPEDIRYNTFRWIATSRGFAMGPSRMNPKTGEILDADIIFDEGMIRYWRREYLLNKGIPQGVELLHNGHQQAFMKIFSPQIPFYMQSEKRVRHLFNHLKESEKNSKTSHYASFSSHKLLKNNGSCQCCMMGHGMQRQLGLIASVMAAKGKLAPGGKIPPEFIGQAIKEVVMHEVGHTLGLRHNFKASTIMTLEQLNDPAIVKEKGLSGSVMDYNPAYFAPEGKKQGDYFSQTIGPYDYWSIEYAYKTIKSDEKKELKKIASRAPEHDLIYGTDEDMFLSPDPRINAYDLGDPLNFAKSRIELVKKSMKGIENTVVEKGDGWQRAREAFSMLLSELYSATYLSSQYIGGEYNNRAHKGDPNAKPPLELIPLAKQRMAIKLIQDEILSGKAFDFSPELLKRLAPEYYMDNFFFYYSNYQYPVYRTILSIQKIALSRFLNGRTLASIQNMQLHAAKGEDVLKISEIFEALTSSIWTEIPNEVKADKETTIELNTIRRNLQREYIKRLSNLTIGRKRSMYFWDFYDYFYYGSGNSTPADAKSLARYHLTQISTRINNSLNSDKVKMDVLTRAHLSETQNRISKVLEASLDIND